ncbi:MAG: GNAT family N-acetyltransferase [Anaerolineales bacterium]|nr:GNAT family N-acetyltransferase [Anaerolineales bacterium]
MTHPLPGPAYRLQTARLILRCWEPRDAPLLSAAIESNIDHLLPWMPWAKDEPRSLQDRLDLLRHWRGNFDLSKDFVYGVFSLDEKIVYGSSGLHTRLGEGVREIGYWIGKQHINQGYATELSAALTKVAFEIEKVRRVEIHCDVHNYPSAAVPRKLGYLHEATLQKRNPDHEGRLCDSMIWTLFVEDYPDSPAFSAPIQAFDVLSRRLL